MSIKIYNAYLWNDTIENLLSYLKEYKKQYIIEIAKRIFRSTVYFEKQIEEYGEGGYWYLLSQKNRTDDDNHYTFSGCCIIYPHDGKIAVQFFYDQFVKLPLDDRFTDYHYQNQSDSDNTEEEDEKRRHFWDEYNVPVEDGFSYEFITDRSLREIWIEYNKLKNIV